MSSILRFDNATVEFRVRTKLLRFVRLRALDRISLHIYRGETLALLGESGSGKTTAARLALRLIKPTNGRVYFKDEDISNWNEQQLKSLRRTAQAVFQDAYSSIDSYLNVRQILEEPLLIHKVGTPAVRNDLIQEALESVGLIPARTFFSLYPHTLSGGQRQRVNIARALTLKPEFLVADEPISMIDASSRIDLINLFQNLRDIGEMSTMYITHDIATAVHFSDRVAVMYAGRIAEMGTTAQIIGEPLHPYTRALIDSVPEPNPLNRFRDRKVIPGDSPSPLTPPSGCRFHPRCPFVIWGKCDLIDPPLIPIGVNQSVACHLHPGKDVARE